MSSKPRSRKPPPALPSPPPRPVRPATATELWYLECLKILTKFLGTVPSVSELARYCGRSDTPVWIAMRSLENKGHVRKSDDRGYEVIGGVA